MNLSIPTAGLQTPEGEAQAWKIYDAELHRAKEVTKATARAEQVASDGAFKDLKYTDERIYVRANWIAETLDPRAHYSNEHRHRICGKDTTASGKIFRRLFVRLPVNTAMRNGELHEYFIHPKVFADLLALTSRARNTGISCQIRKEVTKASCNGVSISQPQERPHETKDHTTKNCGRKWRRGRDDFRAGESNAHSSRPGSN